MAAVGTVQVGCPECDVMLPIGIVARSASREVDGLTVGLEPDLSDVIMHGWIDEDR
ncbi:hypothetical protein [Streptomyces stelliscabiei]|uniref:hypothetical protein n=1 Tax=Streptomyces stelliscabiei TaxID=146820 RepID=UPI002FF24B5D